MLNFIVNRAAGNYHAKNVFKKLKGYLNKNKIVYRVFYGINREQICEIVSKLETDKQDNVIVVGGDGTIHDVVNVIKNFSKIKVGVIPAGASNNFALSQGISLNPIFALQDILNNEVVKLDLMNVSNIIAINSVVISSDYFLKERKVKQEQNKAYNFKFLKIAKNSREFLADCIIDGKEIGEKSVNAIVVSCGAVVLNGLKISLDANNSDGKLDYLEFVSDNIKFKFKNKTLIREEFSKLGSTKISSLKVTSGEDNFNFLIDGELVENLPW